MEASDWKMGQYSADGAWSGAHVDMSHWGRGLSNITKPPRRFIDVDAAGPVPDADVIAHFAPKRPVFDRAESLLAVTALQPDPWTTAMAKQGYMLLGTLCRDAAAMDAALAAVMDLPGVTPTIRRRTLVAASLLGSPETLAAARDLALPAGHDREGENDVRAAFLAAAFADRGDLHDFLTTLSSELTRRHADRAHRAAIRAGKGLALSVSAQLGDLR